MTDENVAGLRAALAQVGLDPGHVGAEAYWKVIAQRLSGLGVTAPRPAVERRDEVWLARWIVEQLATVRTPDETQAWARIECLEDEPSVLGALLHASVGLLSHTLDDAYRMAGADDVTRDVLVAQWADEMVRRAYVARARDGDAAEASSPHETTEVERDPVPCPTSFGGRCQCPGAVHEV